MADTKNLTNSNTTNVKVKCGKQIACQLFYLHSNTTNVEVKHIIKITAVEEI